MSSTTHGTSLIVCIGSIDGRHIRIQCPTNSGSMFFNYKMYFFVVLQAVADARCRFTTLDIGGYGKQSDVGTFQVSDLYRAFKDQILETLKLSPLPNSNITAPYILVGDEVYPLLPFLLKPYGGRQ